MPLNFGYLGLIHLTLPKARIIHVRREPIDTSCFSKLFSGDQPFPYDLTELGRFYRPYEASMLDGALAESAVARRHAGNTVRGCDCKARRLVAFRGLEWMTLVSPSTIRSEPCGQQASRRCAANLPHLDRSVAPI